MYDKPFLDIRYDYEAAITARRRARTCYKVLITPASGLFQDPWTLGKRIGDRLTRGNANRAAAAEKLDDVVAVR